MTATNVLKDRTALVTGASGGLGRAIAVELAARDCPLFLTGRDGPRPTLHVFRSVASGVLARPFFAEAIVTVCAVRS